ncbi:MAG TPA: hypothetical protein VGL08_12305, partial [Paraburkholderia sp.]
VDKALAGATKGIHAIGPGTPPPVAPIGSAADCMPAMTPQDVLDASGKTSGLWPPYFTPTISTLTTAFRTIACCNKKRPS